MVQNIYNILKIIDTILNKIILQMFPFRVALKTRTTENWWKEMGGGG